MSRKVAVLTSDDLEALPDRCQRCLFWELGMPRPIDLELSEDELAGEPLVQKVAWWRALELETHVPGRVLRVDGEVAGWCLLGPPEAFARRRAPVPRTSDDALFLATLWVEPPFRGGGLGRLLLQHAVKEAIRHERRAVEAYGDRRHRDAACVTPATWLLHEGFAVHREHPRYPLLRLDVRSIARWAEPLEHAIEQALARLARRPERAPAPVPHRTAPLLRS